MPNCVVKGCPNKSDKHNKADNITFHKIPTDPIISASWIEKLRLNRKEICWKPNKSTRICSVHFQGNEIYATERGRSKIHKNAVPTLGLHIHCKEANSTLIIKDDPNNSPELNQPEQNTLCNEAIDKVNENKTFTTTPSWQLRTNSNEAQAPKLCVRTLSFEDSSADDLDSIFDTPRKASLRRQLNKMKLAQRKYKRKIRTLQQKYLRIKKKNLCMQKILSKLLSKSIL